MFYPESTYRVVLSFRDRSTASHEDLSEFLSLFETHLAILASADEFEALNPDDVSPKMMAGLIDRGARCPSQKLCEYFLSPADHAVIVVDEVSEQDDLQIGMQIDQDWLEGGASDFDVMVACISDLFTDSTPLVRREVRPRTGPGSETVDYCCRVELDDFSATERQMRHSLDRSSGKVAACC